MIVNLVKTIPALGINPLLTEPFSTTWFPKAMGMGLLNPVNMKTESSGVSNWYHYGLSFHTFSIVRRGSTLNAEVNGHLELPLLKGRQRFDVVSASNLEVYKFQDWWIFTYFIFGPDESSPKYIWSKVNLERTCVLLFYYFLYFKVNLDLEKKNKSAWWSSLNFIFVVVKLDPIILEKRWIDGESWPNDFVEKVNRGEDLRWVGSRCPLTRA